MRDFFDTIYGVSACTTCGDALDGGRYLHTEVSFAHVFCSNACLRVRLRELRSLRWAARHRNLRRLAIAAILIGACLTPHQRRSQERAPATVVARHASERPAREPLPPGWFGPDRPPTDVSVLAALGRDPWIHPLAGPYRRMPRNATPVFGSARPGHPPWECPNGDRGRAL